MNTAEIARKALEILDRDGWNKGALTWYVRAGYPVGSHCIGGAVNLAATGMDEWSPIAEPVYEALSKVIQAQYPEFAKPWHSCINPVMIATWNNDKNITEQDIRRVLEKLANEIPV